MFQIIFILSVAVIISLINVPFLIKKKLFKELIVFSFLLIFGVFITILTILKVKIPNPMDKLADILKIFNQLIEKI